MRSEYARLPLWRAFSSDLCDERTALRGGLADGRCAWAGRTRPRICTHRRAVEVRRHARRRHTRSDPGHPRPDAQPGPRGARDRPSPSASSSTTTTRKARIVPQLAAALPVISKDKLTYTIPLRQGIQFNDGTPFNAQAVVTTLQRMITLPGSIHGQRLRVGRQRHRVRAVHGRHPPEGAVHAADRGARHRGRRRPVADAAGQARRRLRDRSGLRRPVHVRPPRRRRQRHRDQVALLLRPEGRLPRQDRLQADARCGRRRRRR